MIGPRLWLALGGINVLLGLIFGAVGAHAVDASARSAFDTAVFHQTVQGLGLLLMGLAQKLDPRRRLWRRSAALLLVGIVVNNGIILVDYTNLLRKRDYELTRAVVAAGRIRLRPILMTMLTTILALMPLAFFGGSGSELRAPMALTVTGGLLVSTIFTLILIPVLYHLFEGSREKRRLRRLENQNAEQPDLPLKEREVEGEVIRG